MVDLTDQCMRRYPHIVEKFLAEGVPVHGHRRAHRETRGLHWHDEEADAGVRPLRCPIGARR
ncbi:hypothetical protein D3C85_1711090 [compost metagenome]